MFKKRSISSLQVPAILGICLLSWTGEASGSEIEPPATGEESTARLELETIPHPDDKSLAPVKGATGEAAEAVQLERVRIDHELVAQEVLEGAWVITHRLPYSANSLVVEGDDGKLLLVDTPWTADATVKLLEWLDERFGKRPKQAVNTHFHADALGGNAALRDARIPTRGHYLTRVLLQQKGAKRIRQLRQSLRERPLQRDRFRGIEIVAPAQLYVAGEFGLALGSESFKLLHPGAGHSPDNLAVYFPARKLLFGGCMVRAGSSLGFLDDADLATWPDSIRKLQALDLELVVPGHGDTAGPEILQNTLDLLAARNGEPLPKQGAES